MDDIKISEEKIKYVIKTLNEQWDKNDPLIRTVATIIGVITLLFIPILFSLIIILLFGGQRVLYHMMELKKKESYDEVDETNNT
jgi:hypothetical protein